MNHWHRPTRLLNFIGFGRSEAKGERSRPRKGRQGQMAAKTTVKVSRDSGSGQFVTKKYADTHKKTTETETIKKK
jgi:hypothetical protein